MLSKAREIPQAAGSQNLETAEQDQALEFSASKVFTAANAAQR